MMTMPATQPTTQPTDLATGQRAAKAGLLEKPRRAIARLRADVRHFGWAKTTYEVLIEGINLFVDFRVMKVIKKVNIDPEAERGAAEFDWQFFNAGQLTELARNPENQLPEAFVRATLGRGDVCWGALDGELIPFRCWYSRQPTDDHGLLFHFGSDYVYAYNAVALKKYRGQRLYTFSGNRVLREFRAQGIKGMVFTTDSHNFQALRAAAVFDTETVGHIIVLRLGRLSWIYSSRGCRQHGCRMATPTQPPAPVAT